MHEQEIVTIRIEKSNLAPTIGSLVEYKETGGYVYVLTYEQLENVKHSQAFGRVNVNLTKGNLVMVSNRDIPLRLYNYITEKVINNGDKIILYKTKEGYVKNADGKLVFNRIH